jgi:vanillate O-demethylase ferredoxin subunit
MNDQNIDLSTTVKKAKLEVLVRSVMVLADNICSFELVDPAGHALPEFTAGAHVDIHLANGLIRQYSLCTDPAETDRYVIAVLREPQGRGGSVAMHEELRPGTRVTISAPRNNFKLAAGAERHVFLAGGIGITPIMSMIAAAQAGGKDFHLYYCARSPERTAFLDVLQPLVAAGKATVHFDGGDPARSLDLKAVLRDHRPGTHLYYCGPNGMLNAAEAASEHWPPGTRHCERFSAAPAAPAAAPDLPFEIELARSGGCYVVAPGKSIVQVLKANGITVETSCEEGFCGTCMTRYLAGQPLHRDTVLDDEDREEFLMICCSRAKSGRIVLDL